MTDYSKKGHYYIDEPRFEVKKLASLLPKRAKILDIGAGFGNNTKFLLDAGHKVVALEPNPQAVKALKELQINYPELEVVEGAIDSYKPTEKYDAVICCMVIHFVKDHAVGEETVRKLQSWTKPGGINLVTGYMNGQPLPKDYTFLLELGELSAFYKDWKIHWYEESFRLSLHRIYSLGDIPRLLLGRRGFRAARIIAHKK